MHNAPHLTVRISQTKKKTTLVGGLKKEPEEIRLHFRRWQK